MRNLLPQSLRLLEIISLEVSPDFVGNEESVEDFEVAEWTKLPVKNDSSDGFLSLEALHHTDQRDVFYAEVNRVLKKGGALVIGDVERGNSSGWIFKWLC